MVWFELIKFTHSELNNVNEGKKDWSVYVLDGRGLLRH
jgi:hypothetical protein